VGIESAAQDTRRVREQEERAPILPEPDRPVGAEIHSSPTRETVSSIAPQRYASYEAQMDRMSLDLQAGGIPDEFREEFRLVDPQSKEGIAFQQICERVARRLYTPDEVVEGRIKSLDPLSYLLVHDFDASPVRFLLSKDKSANAMFLTMSSPPIIILNEGLFTPQKQRGEIPVQSEEDLMLVLGHEMTHAKFKERHGRGPNSKPEEALCDTVPMRLLHYIGRDPAAILSFDERTRGPRIGRSTWGQLVEAHLTGPSRQSVYEAALTELGRSIGAVAASKGERTELPDGLIETVRSALHVSFLDELKAKDGYILMESRAQADVLFETIGQIGTDFPVRAADIAAELSTIGLSLDRKADRESVDRWVNDLFSFLQTFKEDESHSPHDPAAALRSMYVSLSAATGSTKLIRPLGKSFRELSAAMREVRDATEEESAPHLRRACARLVTLYTELGWSSSVEGRDFLRSISWPNFALPDIDGNPSRQRSYAVEWNFLAEHAEINPEVAFAGVIMGLSPDPRIRAAAKSFLGRIDLVSFDRLVQQRGRNLLSSVTRGPCDSDGTALHQCDVNRRGRLTGLSGTSDVARDERLSVEAVVQGGELMEHITRTLISEGASPRSTSVTLTPERLERILCFDTVSAAQILLDVLSAPDAKCSDEMLKVIMEKSDFVVMHAEHAKSASSGDGSFTPRNSLELIEKLSAARSSNRPLYDAVMARMPTQRFQLFYRKSSHESLTGPLKMFAASIAPELSDDQLLVVLNKAACETTTFVPDDMRQLCVSRLGYPPEPSAETLLQWMEKQTNAALGDAARLASRCEWGSDSFSGVLALCSRDLKEILKSGSLGSRDLVKIASLCVSLEECFNYDLFLNHEKVALAVAEIPFDQEGPSALELAQAWRDLYALNLLGPKREEALLAHVINTIEKLEPLSSLRREALERLLAGSRMRQPDLRDRAVSMWVNDAARELGSDDLSEGFRLRVEERLRPLVEATPVVDLQRIGVDLAETTLTQRACSMSIEELVNSSPSVSKFSLASLGVGVEVFLLAIKSHESERNLFLNYLLSSGAASETSAFVGDMAQLLPAPDGVSRSSRALREKALRTSTASTLKLLHTEFWRLPLEGRAVFAKELLPTAAQLSVDTSFDFVVETVLPPTMPHYQATRDLLKRYVHALPGHAQHLALAALLTAGQPGQRSATTPGAILAKFAESQGPAEIKFVQVLMDAPGLPDDFRRDLIEHARHLKYKTQAPSRAQIFRLLDVIEQRDGVTFGHIGKLRGCGSMNIVVEVAEGVLCLRRPNCRARAEDGFDIMLRMVGSMNREDPIVQAVRPIIHDARERAALESNFMVAQEQYDRAAVNYQGYVAHVDGHAIPLDSARVFRAGEDFFTMSEMKGEHFISRLEREGSTPELRRVAKAILAREFNAILRGVFDCDRHGGQIAVGDAIGHFDFKAMALEHWSEDDHRQLAHVLITTAMKCATTSDIAPKMVEVLEQLRADGKSVSKMVTEAQKAILSLGDYFKALAPMPEGTFMQLLMSGLSAEMPEHLQKLYAQECTEILMPIIRESAGIFGGMIPKTLVSAAIRESLSTGALSAAALKVLPKEFAARLPRPETRIRFERLSGGDRNGR
jgi:hypothetical protein